MGKFKMMLVPGMVLGMGAMLMADNPRTTSVPAPEAQKDGANLVAAMNQQAGTPVAKAFDFLPATVATIDGKAVTKDEFIKFAAQQIPNGMIPAQVPVEMLKMQAPQMVEQYVLTQVIDQAVAKSGIKVTAADIAAQIKSEIEKMPQEQRNMIEQMLKAQGKTIDSIIKEQSESKEAQKMLAFEKFIEQKTGKLEVTQAELEKFYKENPEQFVEPGDPEGSVRASHILIGVDKDADEKAWAKAKAECEAILAELKKGADFGKLAAEKSTCPSGKSAQGSLGAFSTGQMVPEFEKAAFALKAGELSAPVKTQFGYHIIRRDAAQSERKIELAEVKDRLQAMLLNQKRNEAAQKVFAQLMKDAKVQILVKAPAMPAAPAAAPAAPAQTK